MERNQHIEDQNTQPTEYSEPNDTSTYMSEMDKLLRKLEREGYTDQYKVEKNKLYDLSNEKKYKPKDVKAVNFYRFEGMSNPDDTSILYAIETCDGRKGTLINAYGLYSDDDLDKFMKEVEVNKRT